MTRQLPLAMSLRPEVTLEEFVAGANRQLLQALNQLATGSEDGQIFLSGPVGSGKSHLLMGSVKLAQQQGRSCAYLPFSELMALSPEVLEGMEQYSLLAFDDVHLAARDANWEKALFRLFNQARETGASLLFAADRGPASLELHLPDLRSRLAWGSSYRLQPLDDRGREELLLRQAQKRGLRMKPRAAAWMVAHCSRDPRELLRLLERLDTASLAAHRQLTLPFVRELLG